MNKRIGAVLLIFSILLGASSVCLSYYPYLNEKQIQEAIQYGKNNKHTGPDKFNEEWQIRPSNLHGWITIVTPFSYLAGRAKEAAIQYRSVSKEEIKKANEWWGNKLGIRVMMFSELFPIVEEGYHMVLHYKGHYIQPQAKENLDVSTTGEYVALFSYAFPVQTVSEGKRVSIDPNETVTLVLISGTGEEKRFRIDLSSFR